MKILSIRIKNLASLAGEHFIDFESEPLASAGLVAIIGKTGAGKSTILDAMCLALFNRVPRLKDSDGKLIDVDGSELPTNSPQTVLRRGTGQGFAELSFIAQDQKVYSARWEIKRARENPNGKLQSVQRSLKCLTDGTVVADKTKAVESQILRITQLSFEQFTRAVLLAQSEVTAFLKARDNERGELLEYLTNSSIFGKIGQLAFEKTKQIANQRKALEVRLGDIEILSDEDLALYTANFQSHTESYQKFESEKQQLLKQQQWFQHKDKLIADIQQREQYLAVQQQQLDALQPQKQQLQQLEKFASIRPSIIQRKNLSTEIATLQPQLAQAQQQFSAIEIKFNHEKTQFKQLDLQQKQQHQFEVDHQDQIDLVRARIADRRVLGDQLIAVKDELKKLQEQHAPLLQSEQQLQQVQQQLEQQLEQQNTLLLQTAHFQVLDEALSAHLSPLQRFIQSYVQFEQQYGDVAQATEQLAQKQQQLEQLIQQFGHDPALNTKITGLRTAREELLHRLNQLDVTKSHWQRYHAIHLEHQQKLQEQQKLQSDLAQHQQQCSTAETEFHTQKSARESLQTVLQQQRLLHAENIEQLRANLVAGEACLVCGSTEHPYTHNQDELSHELLKLQEQQEQQALAQEKVAFDLWQQLQKKCTQQSTAFEANAQQLIAISTQQSNVQTQLEQSLNALNIPYDLHSDLSLLETAITHHIAQTQQSLQQTEADLKTHEQAQQNSQTLSQYIQHTTKQLTDVQHAEQNIQPILSILNDTEKHAWQQSTRTAAEQVYEKLQQRLHTLKQRNELNTQLNQKTQQLEQAKQQSKFSQENIAATEKRIAKLLEEGKQNSDLAIQAIFTMTQVTVEKPHEWLLQFEQNRQQLQTQFNTVRQQFEQRRQAFDTAQATLQKYQAQQLQLQTQQNAAALSIQQWLALHIDFNNTLLQQLSEITHEQELQLKQQISSAERAYSDAQSAKKTLDEQLQQHLMLQPEIEFEALLSQLQSLVEQITQVMEQRDEVKLKLEVHQRNVAKQQQFTDQIQQIQSEEHRWNKISSLMGDATGKKFRDLAQQYNLDILIEYANQQLAMLSQRYTLKRLENSLSLAIIDHDMDGETRSVSSLSGGESFLTALALSLAIASMASGTTKIESLFIDEGFGTLDASSLHMVMNALDQLQNQGRKVVLISHIQEMHERIPVQIQVNPVGAGASTIQIVS
ncbi:AAA family ATPase [Acinetobacter sp. YH12073]|uniref:AAA family ATPase n=1 Tax=Acinetobacter sp. YH12073 TaxID=2601069 RepID=UPI0015D43258|nr:AAA family ATPase [Acinetobacter sp. YH12073]